MLKLRPSKIFTVINENEHRYHFKHAVDDMKFSDGNYIDLLMDETYKKVKQSIKAHKTAVELVLSFKISNIVCKMSYISILLYIFLLHYVMLDTWTKSTPAIYITSYLS